MVDKEVNLWWLDVIEPSAIYVHDSRLKDIGKNAVVRCISEMRPDESIKRQIVGSDVEFGVAVLIRKRASRRM
jgi:hypothetical protein